MGDPKTEGAGLAGLRTVVDEINLDLMKRDGCKDYTLEPDATFIPAGKEAALYSYLKEKGYMPMMAALYENGLFIDDEFREGNESPQNGHVEVCRRSKALVARAGKQIIARISKSAWVRVSDDVEVAETVHAQTRDRSTPLSGRLVSYRYWVVASTSLPTSRPPASWNNTSSGESSRTSSRGSRAMGASDTCRPERAMPTRSGSGSAWWPTTSSSGSNGICSRPLARAGRSLPSDGGSFPWRDGLFDMPDPWF